jgi:hypothetical protein
MCMYYTKLLTQYQFNFIICDPICGKMNKNGHSIATFVIYICVYDQFVEKWTKMDISLLIFRVGYITKLPTKYQIFFLFYTSTLFLYKKNPK